MGAAQGAFDLAVDYVHERKAFGSTIASFQNTVQASRDETELELNRALAEKYTQKFIDGELTSAEASMLKLASE